MMPEESNCKLVTTWVQTCALCTYLYVGRDDEEDETSGEIFCRLCENMCILSWCEILAGCTDMAANFIQCDIRRDSTALNTDSHALDCQFGKYKET